LPLAALVHLDPPKGPAAAASAMHVKSREPQSSENSGQFSVSNPPSPADDIGRSVGLLDFSLHAVSSQAAQASSPRPDLVLESQDR